MIITSRESWGARYARGFAPALLPAREVWLHHTAMVAPGPDVRFEVDAAAARDVERVGQQRFGGGISYTFLVMPSGRVMEGHGIGRRGAHTKGRNSISRAICLHGNYQDHEPSGRMLSAVIELLHHGAQHGWWPDQLAGGHRNAPGASTSCPGEHAYRHIPEINRLARVSGPAARPSHQEDELSARAEEQIDELHREIFFRLPNRRGPGASTIPADQSGGGSDTTLGYAAFADGWGYRGEQALARIEARLDAIERRLG